jgi:hypothetical protein
LNAIAPEAGRRIHRIQGDVMGIIDGPDVIVDIPIGLRRRQLKRINVIALRRHGDFQPVAQVDPIIHPHGVHVRIVDDIGINGYQVIDQRESGSIPGGCDDGSSSTEIHIPHVTGLKMICPKAMVYNTLDITE